jgi:hypothetical protein
LAHPFPRSEWFGHACALHIWVKFQHWHIHHMIHMNINNMFIPNKQVESCFLNHNSSIHFSCADSLLMTHRGGLSLSIIIWRIGGGRGFTHMSKIPTLTHSSYDTHEHKQYVYTKIGSTFLSDHDQGRQENIWTPGQKETWPSLLQFSK